MAEDKQFYVGQKALIEKNGQVLVLNDPNYGLDFPGGKIQIDEDNFEEALKREVREETGLEIEVGIPIATWQFKNNKYGSNRIIFMVAHKANYVSGEVKLSDEHDGFRWVSKENFHEVDNGEEYPFKVLKAYFQGA